MGVTQTGQASAGPPGRETIEQLFAALESLLLTYALRLVTDRSIAEDIVQEAFTRLHEQFKQVREPRRWLYRTVHNLSINHLRQTAKTISMTVPAQGNDSSEMELPDPQPPADEQISRWEDIGLVRLSIEALDERSRELVHLKFNEDLSYKDISSKTGLTVSNVGYLLHHALKAVADVLSKKGIRP